MANGEKKQEQRHTLQKRVALKEDAYYANCTMVEMTPFDLSILFGKVRPVTDANGQSALVEMYDRQVYLSNLEAGVLYEALGRRLSSLSRQGRRPEGTEQEAEEGIVVGGKNQTKGRIFLLQSQEKARCAT